MRACQRPSERRSRSRIPIAIRNASTGQSSTAAAIVHMAQVGRLFTALLLADTDLRYLAPLWSTTRPAAHPRSPGGSSGAGSRPALGGTSGCGQSKRWSSQAIRRAERIASPGLSPTAIAMIETAHSGRLSNGAMSPSCTNLGRGFHAMVTGSLTDAQRPPVHIRRGLARAYVRPLHPG